FTLRGPEESSPNDQPPWIPVGENDIVASISKGVKSLTLSKEFKDKLCKPWSRSFIIRLLGKSIGYSFLCQRLHAMWKPVGHLHIVDLDRSCFLVKFGNDQDYFKALTGGLGSFWTSTLSFINGTNLSGCQTSSQTSWLRGFGFLTSLFNSTTLKSWHLWGTPLVRLSRSTSLGGSLQGLQSKLTLTCPCHRLLNWTDAFSSWSMKIFTLSTLVVVEWAREECLPAGDGT
ncbi:hypothetical protein LINPERPRIM_LOCUS5876, partial [Linum perenne]